MKTGLLNKALIQLSETAKKQLADSNSTPEEKRQAKIIESLVTIVIMLQSQRNHYLAAFAEAKYLEKEVSKKAKEEDSFLMKSLNTLLKRKKS